MLREQHVKFGDLCANAWAATIRFSLFAISLLWLTGCGSGPDQIVIWNGTASEVHVKQVNVSGEVAAFGEARLESSLDGLRRADRALWIDVSPKSTTAVVDLFIKSPTGDLQRQCSYVRTERRCAVEVYIRDSEAICSKCESFYIN